MTFPFFFSLSLSLLHPFHSPSLVKRLNVQNHHAYARPKHSQISLVLLENITHREKTESWPYGWFSNMILNEITLDLERTMLDSQVDDKNTGKPVADRTAAAAEWRMVCNDLGGQCQRISTSQCSVDTGKLLAFHGFIHLFSDMATKAGTHRRPRLYNSLKLPNEEIKHAVCLCS